MDHVVGMGQYVVTDREDDVLNTFALASCVAVTAYSPLKKAAGMIHIVLPTPLGHRDEAERPGYFALTGVPLLIEEMCRRYNCRKDELDIQMFGGASSTYGQDVFQVGMKNINAVKYSLFNLGLSINGADLRGNQSRTLKMDVKTGTVKIFRQPM